MPDDESAQPRRRNGSGSSGGRRPSNYLLFEAKNGLLKVGDKLTFVGRVEGALDRKDARWKLVEQNNELAMRVLYGPDAKPGDEPQGAWLVAVAERLVVPEFTVEQAEITKVRT